MSSRESKNQERKKEKEFRTGFKLCCGCWQDLYPLFFFFQAMNVKSSTNIRSRRSKGKVIKEKGEKGEGDVEQ